MPAVSRPLLPALHATDYRKNSLPDVRPDSTNYAQTHDYGKELRDNKGKLQKAMKEKNVSEAYQALFTAMAMIETNTMDVRDLDHKKDGATDGSANVSIFNISDHLVFFSGYFDGLAGYTEVRLPASYRDKLNSDAGLADAVGVLNHAIAKVGVRKTLAFVRAGWEGYQGENEDVAQHVVQPYLGAVAWIVKEIDEHPNLLTDGQRVEMTVPYYTKAFPTT